MTGVSEITLLSVKRGAVVQDVTAWALNSQAYYCAPAGDEVCP